MSESAAASIVYPCEGEGKMQPSGSGHNYQYTTEALKEERDGVWEFIKRLGMTFVEGKDLVSVSMPVTMCEPASFLERMTRGWVTMPRYCALIAGADTPLERMKLTVAMVISGLHINTNCKKPFNPLLGETHEASFEDGTEIFSEQTSHHPPVSSWEVHGTSGWRFTGTAQWSGYFAGNAVKGGQLGDNILELPDGYRVQWHLPSIHVSGVLTGNRVLDHVGFVEFKDNSEPPLVARIGFGDQRSNMEWVADGGKWLAGALTGGWWGGGGGGAAAAGGAGDAPAEGGDAHAVLQSDELSGSVYIAGGGGGGGAGENRLVLSTVSGSWLTGLGFKDKGEDAWRVYWKKAATPVVPISNAAKSSVLGSDGRLRDDIVALAEHRIDAAQEAKERIEDEQRRLAKLRKAAA